MNDESTSTMTWREWIGAASIALLLVIAAAFSLQQKRIAEKGNTRSSIAASLRRVEAAKLQYAMDNHLKRGDWIALSRLRHHGYLSDQKDSLPDDVHFVPGAVGEEVTYHFADGPHQDHYRNK